MAPHARSRSIAAVVTAALAAAHSIALASLPHGPQAPPPAAAAPQSGPGASAAAGTAGAAGSPTKYAPALDPDPSGDRCTGYAFDGITLGMTRDQAASAVPLSPVPEKQSQIPAHTGRTSSFAARRPGRIDVVQVGFSSAETDGRVDHIRASVMVAREDSWPRPLVSLLGTPKRARPGETIWWDGACRATLRLTRIDPLGRGSGQPYILEIQHTQEPRKAPDDAGSPEELTTPAAPEAGGSPH